MNPRGIAAAGVAVTAWGLTGVIAKDIELGGLVIGVYRFSVYGLVLIVVMALRGQPMSLRAMRASFLGGLALGSDIAFFFSAVKLTTIANATVIGALQPVVVSIVAARFFGEWIARRDMALGVVAIVGVAVAVLAGADDAPRDGRGDLLAVAALFSWSAYFVFAKRAKDKITSQEYTTGVALWAGLFNIPLALMFGQDLSWPNSTSWFWLLVLAFGAGLLGHSMMNWSIQQIPLWVSSTMTLLIPVTSAAVAWWALGEPLTAVQMAAMAVVLATLAVIVSNQTGIGNRPRPLRR